jgi:hypothetical protein
LFLPQIIEETSDLLGFAAAAMRAKWHGDA